MPSKASEHFDEYRRQTRVKHQILIKNLHAYFTIFNKHAPGRIVYVDAFAGTGKYKCDDQDRLSDGSPIRVLRLAASDPDFSKKIQCVFVEKHTARFSELKATVGRFLRNHSLRFSPILLQSTFADIARDAAQSIYGGKPGHPPTFWFIDPCGISGIEMDAINLALSGRQSEVFVFLNVDGLTRVLGATSNQPALVDLFGSESTILALRKLLAESRNPAERDAIILRVFTEAIETVTGIPFILPFRIESERRTKTSHYLIHATRHEVGFKIMKDIMWDAGKDGQSDEIGGMELLQRSSMGTSWLVRTDLAAASKQITDHLAANGKTKIETFVDEWIYKPANLYTDRVYKSEILKLAQNGEVDIFKSEGKASLNPASIDSLRKLRKDYFVALKGQEFLF